MKKCTGCGWIEGKPLGLNANQEKYIGCCPDGRYKELTAMQELKYVIEQMINNGGTEEDLFAVIAHIDNWGLEKERLNIIRAVNKTNEGVLCTLSGIKHEPFTGSQYYDINFYNEKD